MSQIKVYLQYPLVKSDSQYYKSILDNPPKDIEYTPSHGRAGMIVSARRIKIMRRIKLIVRWIFNKTKFPLPSAFYIKSADKYDLIHCAHCLSLNKKPWVADVEFPSQMWGGVKLTRLRKKIVRRILMSKYCKKIIPWTEATKKSILKDFPEIKNKIELVSYAMPAPKFKKIKSNKINLLFTARYFCGKGGLDAIEVMDRLTKKYPHVNGIIISDVPGEIKNKYSKNKKIRIYELMPYKKILEEIYPISDIYVYPGYTDSFGFSFIEAQAFGIPVVTVDGYSRRENVLDGQTGYIIPNKKNVDYNKLNLNLVEELLNKTEFLINNEKIRNGMSRKGINSVKNGKFSLKNRNDRLRKIYEESIK